jgi:uncharacterized protein
MSESTTAAQAGIAATLLVIAKSPIAGFAKTRLTPPFSPCEAAQLAAAALLDTLSAVRHSGVRHCMVAWTGDLTRAERSDELSAALEDFDLVPQRGDTFGQRLANAHADAARLGLPVLQIGMDTPQITPGLLADTVELTRHADAGLGPAADGGWWALALRDPREAAGLDEVPMSTSDTLAHTRNYLTERGNRVSIGVELSDVDTMSDARKVAESLPDSQFAHAVSAVRAIA